MRIPVIFLFKNIFDFLIYFYNADNMADMIVNNQCCFDVFNGLLQNELAPSLTTISLHNSLHYAQSILTCGDSSSCSCFLSESFYELIKNNVLSCKFPIITGGRRYITMYICKAFMKMKDKDKSKLNIQLSEDSKNVIDLPMNNVMSSITLESSKIQHIIQGNVYDDSSFYIDPSYPRETLFDYLLNKEVSIFDDNINSVVNDYFRL